MAEKTFTVRRVGFDCSIQGFAVATILAVCSSQPLAAGGVLGSPCRKAEEHRRHGCRRRPVQDSGGRPGGWRTGGNRSRARDPCTVFAPTDDAFKKLPAGTVENLLKPENKAQFVAVLTYHVVPGGSSPLTWCAD